MITVRFAVFVLAASAGVAVYSCGDGEGGVAPPPANQAPVAVGAIPAQEVPATDTVTVDLSTYFSDPDGDRLVYSASTSNAAVVTASVSAGTLSLTAVGKGAATVTVTARDPGGLGATQSVEVTVVAKPGFLHVVFQHPEPDIGAVVILVEGPSVDSVLAEVDLVEYHARVPEGVRAFVAGQFQTAGTDRGKGILRFWSRDISESGGYRVTVEQAAGRTYEQRSVESARATIVRQAASPDW